MVYGKDKDLSLEKSVAGKPIYSYFFDLKPAASQQHVDKIIDDFIVK